MPRATVRPNARFFTERRGLLGLTQEALWDVTDVSVKKISDIEAGKPTTRATLEKFVGPLRLSSVDELIQDDNVAAPTGNEPGTGPAARPPERGHSAGAVPRMSPKLFGRDALLRALVDRLVGLSEQGLGSGEKLLSLQGMPGLGKTALAVALAYAREVRDAYPDGLFWANLGQQAEPLVILERWCWDLGVPHLLHGVAAGTGPGGQPARLEAASARFRAFLLQQNKRILFFLDDCWRPEHARYLIVGGGGCATVLTTRLLTITNELVPSRDRYEPSRLGEADSLALLQERAGEGVVASYPEQCRELTRRLDGLPLALVVAGSLLDRCACRGHPVGELIRNLRERTARLLAEPVPADVSQFLSDVDSPNLVALLQLSTDWLDERARECFAVLGDVTPSGTVTFNLELLAGGWGLPPGEAERIADALIDNGLMQVAREELGARRYYMHDLLIQHAKTLFEVEG